MSDLSNTGDIHQHVEDMLASHHEHHGEAGHHAGEFNAWGTGHVAEHPANDHTASHKSTPELPAVSYVSKYARKSMGRAHRA